MATLTELFESRPDASRRELGDGAAGRPIARGADVSARMLRMPAVQARSGPSRSATHRRISSWRFPGPVERGGDAVGRVDEEVDVRIRQQIAASCAADE